MIRTSDTVGELFAALAGAQSEMPSAAKDATGQVGQARTKYADLPAVREAARDPLTKHGLAFVQFPTSAPPGSVRIITRIVHKSGEWIEDDEGFTVPAGNNTAQAVGSAMTYARRYSLQAALGIVADDDDDGHAATSAAQAPRRAREPRQTGGAAQTTPDGITEAQLRKLHATYSEAGLTHREQKAEFVKRIIGREVESSKDLTKREAATVIDALETAIAGERNGAKT